MEQSGGRVRMGVECGMSRGGGRKRGERGMDERNDLINANTNERLKWRLD